ncbi:MAG: hypothetical protein J2P26_11725 [Nocardiopsaceae bacterium]|nr:hypothetical protein [Nocardiopsaceae bacterium]
METYLIFGAIVTAIAAGPFAVPAAAGASHAAAASAQAEQEATRHQASAVLLQRAADGGKSYSAGSQVLARAAWRAPDGAPRTGQVMAQAGAAQGSSVRVWTDQAGHLTSPPLTSGQIESQADLAGAATGIALALLALGESLIIQRAMDRRRMAEWDAEWSATEPSWNR